MENQNIQKPLILLRQDFYDTIINTINSSGLPAFIIEPILKELLEQTQNSMKNEYNLSLKWYNENKNKSE